MYRNLTMVLRWLAVVLILRVLATILANYPDYFPPNFDSLFLQGREATFTGTYEAAFYVHIFSGPVVLFNGLILLSETFRRRSSRLAPPFRLGSSRCFVGVRAAEQRSDVPARFWRLACGAEFSLAVGRDRELRHRRRRARAPPPLRPAPSLDATLLCIDLFGGIPASDFGNGRAGRGAQPRARLHLRCLEQLAVPPGSLRTRRALTSASAV